MWPLIQGTNANEYTATRSGRIAITCSSVRVKPAAVWNGRP